MSPKRPIIKKQAASANLAQLKKGQLLGVKAPPLYKQEYVYEVSAAGEKMIRADYFHCPTVKKSWSREELSILLDLGMVRIIAETEAQALRNSPAGQSGDES